MYAIGSNDFHVLFDIVRIHDRHRPLPSANALPRVNAAFGQLFGGAPLNAPMGSAMGIARCESAGIVTPCIFFSAGERGGTRAYSLEVRRIARSMQP